MNKLNPFDTFNSDVVKDINKISEEINNECESEAPDKDKVSKLMWKQLIKGMELNSSIGGRFYYKPF